MSKNRFFEGLIIGSIIGAIASCFFKELDCGPCKVSSESDSDADKKGDTPDSSPAKKVNTEKLVSKTLEAIEQGFEKLSGMIDEKKATK